MTAQNRIRILNLLEKLDKYPELKKEMGVNILLTDNIAPSKYVDAKPIIVK